MARKSERLSSISAATSGHKRTASSTTLEGTEGKKVKGQKVTPTKSQYFKHGGDDSDAEPMSSDTPNDEASDFDDEDGNASSSEEAGDDDYDNDEERPQKSSQRKGNELWRQGVKAGLGPGKQVIIKKPQARKPGKTPYSNETIHPNTLLFLKDLKANNDREWLKMHDPDFRQSERDWHSFVEELTSRLTAIDDTIPELPYKDVIFRIYRDVRFSSDPTPYKPHFSAAWSRTGRKGPYAHYYVQIAPGNQSFVGGGLWHPEASPTAAMRRDIDRRPQRIKGVLMGDGVRKEFLAGAPKSDEKVVKAFFKSNSENALRTKPKGYDADHKDIELLRLKNYTVGRKLSDDEVTGREGIDRVAELFACLKPFITYLNSVVMPDEESSDSESGSESESEASGEEEESGSNG